MFLHFIDICLGETVLLVQNKPTLCKTCIRWIFTGHAKWYDRLSSQYVHVVSEYCQIDDLENEKMCDTTTRLTRHSSAITPKHLHRKLVLRAQWHFDISESCVVSRLLLLFWLWDHVILPHLLELLSNSYSLQAEITQLLRSTNLDMKTLCVTPKGPKSEAQRPRGVRFFGRGCSPPHQLKGLGSAATSPCGVESKPPVTS